MVDMTGKKSLRSFSSDDEPQARSVQHHIEYVRRPISPRRNNSFERIRPQNDIHGRTEQRKSGQEYFDSDDDFVYKVDGCGRRYGTDSRRRSQSRSKHERARENHPYMSGGLGVESALESGYESSDGQSAKSRDIRKDRWSSTVGPLEIRVVQPEIGRRNQESCRCRRCHDGRPGSRYDHERKRRKYGRRTDSRPANKTTSEPRGILRRSSSEHERQPRLRKCVSFEHGTKVPHDLEESSRTCSSDDQDTRFVPRRQHRRPKFDRTQCQRERPREDASPSSNIPPSESDSEKSSFESSSTENENNVRKVHGRSRPRTFREERCKCCHHCPTSQERNVSPVGCPEPSSQAKLQTEESVQSIAHAILLSTHQSWCKGDCMNLNRFARRMGACSICRKRWPNDRRIPTGQPIPNCRTLIRCRRFTGDLFEGTGSIPGEGMDSALRFGFANVFRCTIPSYLAVEEYLAFRAQQVDEQHFGRWIQNEVVRDHTENIHRLGCKGVDLRIPPGPGRNFLICLGKEVDKTKKLWKEIRQSARNNGQPWEETIVLKLLEDIVGDWKPRWVREEEYDWFWD